MEPHCTCLVSYAAIYTSVLTRPTIGHSMHTAENKDTLPTLMLGKTKAENGVRIESLHPPPYGPYDGSASRPAVLLPFFHFPTPPFHTNEPCPGTR